MLTLLLTSCGVALVGAQIKVPAGETRTFNTNGWFLTDSQLVDIQKAIEEADLLRRRAVLGDSLAHLYEQRVSDLNAALKDQQELIRDYEHMKAPGMIEQMTDRGTAAVMLILFGAYLYNDR